MYIKWKGHKWISQYQRRSEPNSGGRLRACLLYLLAVAVGLPLVGMLLWLLGVVR